MKVTSDEPTHTQTHQLLHHVDLLISACNEGRQIDSVRQLSNWSDAVM